MYLEVAAQSSSTKKVFLKLFQNLEGTFARVSFSKKFQVRDLQLYEKGTPAQVLPSKFSKTSKINIFYETNRSKQLIVFSFSKAFET